MIQELKNCLSSAGLISKEEKKENIREILSIWAENRSISITVKANPDELTLNSTVNSQSTFDGDDDGRFSLNNTRSSTPDPGTLVFDYTYICKH